jgi:C4-dicarboxylate-specific signal transduction histidine kinase
MVQAPVDQVVLRDVLDDLRIVIESDWQEIGGIVRWHLPEESPIVLAERHGLLQAFLNLSKNSLRAVQEGENRELAIEVESDRWFANVVFRDTGPGVTNPDRLFAPFQPGADGSGLGLYVARAVLRSYGGDLRYEETSQGACFRAEIPLG